METKLEPRNALNLLIILGKIVCLSIRFPFNIIKIKCIAMSLRLNLICPLREILLPETIIITKILEEMQAIITNHNNQRIKM
jgi:hypothetical protein